MRTAIVVAISILMGSTASSALAASSARGVSPPDGKLRVRVVGLPKHEPGVFTLTGPRQSPHAHRRLRLRLSRQGTTAVGRLRTGVYRVTVSPVRIRRSRKAIRRGAIAYPVHRRLRFKLKARAKTTVNIRYGTIVNPGVRSVTGRIAMVLGTPGSPSGVVLRGRRGVRIGSILSAHPSRRLPKGLLARVQAVKHRNGRLIVHLLPASIYEVAPNMSFDIPLSGAEAASASRLIECGRGPAVHPYVNVSDIHLTGGWTTTRVAFVQVTTGATMDLRFRAGAGVRVESSVGFACELKLPEVALEGMAGPIPVYGGIKPTAKAEASAAGKLYSEGSTEVTLGARISAVPPVARPALNFSSPNFKVGAELFVGLKASLGLDAELGVGAANAANLHVTFGNSLDFTAAPGNCSWDLNLGTFSGGGQLGPFDISTPSTPPLYHHNLWHQPCGSPPPPPPSPPPSSGPPVLSVPLTRATMSWDTDSDLDLYSWDQSGNYAYFGEKLGVPDAELIEDIIPSEGEVAHPSEVFQETANPGRTYTFGICDYRGEGGNVTLDVHDPSGATRTFHRSLGYVGDNAIITTSPEGSGYIPPSGWCRNIDEDEEYEYEE